MQIERMTAAHEKDVLSMVEKFYHSPAVDHTVPSEILGRTFAAAVSAGSNLEGYILTEDGMIAGFAYVTSYFACECGGDCIMIEEIYIDEKYRGQGFGRMFMNYVFQQYKSAKRFRLEVTDENEGAVRLYKNLGFKFINYGQMVKDI